MTVITHFAMHHLEIVGGQVLRDVESGLSFNMQQYSLLKYGDAKVARQWGIMLAHAFIRDRPDVVLTPQRIIVTGPSYKYLSTAAQGVSESFLTVLNAARVRTGKEPATPMHIIRAWVGSDSYAMASLEERKRQLPIGGQHVDHGLVKDSVVLVIDDVSITGNTEHAIEAHLLPAEPAAICFIHVASVEREQALEHATIEDVMNKVVPPTLENILERLQANNLRLNSRVLRTIIETSESDKDKLGWFLSECSSEFLLEMYDALVGGTLEMYQRYPSGTAQLEWELARRGLFDYLISG